MLLCDFPDLVAHVGFGVLNGDTELLSELLEFLKVLTGTSTSGFVSLFEELGAVLGDGLHNLLEILKLVHLDAGDVLLRNEKVGWAETDWLRRF